jgi:hypothetical protein
MVAAIVVYVNVEVIVKKTHLPKESEARSAIP